MPATFIIVIWLMPAVYLFLSAKHSNWEVWWWGRSYRASEERVPMSVESRVLVGIFCLYGATAFFLASYKILPLGPLVIVFAGFMVAVHFMYVRDRRLRRGR
jgi:hypothetical protein